MQRTILSYFLLFITLVKSEEADYFWRDYNGLIPEDAFPAGKTINGNDTYIGQVYVHGHGLFIAQLTPGTTNVEVPCYGVKKKDAIIKILCSKHKDNFGWLSTTWTSFHLDSIDKHVVVGGYDHVGNKGIINIGRVMHQGILKIGQVGSYGVDQVFFYFEHKNIMQMARTFEVLIYSSAPSIEPRTKN